MHRAGDALDIALDITMDVALETRYGALDIAGDILLETRWTSRLTDRASRA